MESEEGFAAQLGFLPVTQIGAVVGIWKHQWTII